MNKNKKKPQNNGLNLFLEFYLVPHLHFLYYALRMLIESVIRTVHRSANRDLLNTVNSSSDSENK